MIKNLETFFVNPFSNSNISITDEIGFTVNHIENLKANPRPALTALIAPTQAALDAVTGAFGIDLSNLSDRKIAIQKKNDFRAGLAAAISPIAVKVMEQFGENSAEYKGFFPEGRAAFSTCADDRLAEELTALVTQVTKYQAQLGADTVTAATALQTTWTGVYAPAKTAAGTKGGSKNVKNTARAALELQLFINLLTIAKEFPDQPNMLGVYMQQSLLAPHSGGSPAPTPPPTPSTPTLNRDTNGHWTVTYSDTAQSAWQIWARYDGSPDWSMYGELQATQFPASDDIMSPGGAWWQVKVCGEDDSNNQTTSFSNVVSFGTVPS